MDAPLQNMQDKQHGYAEHEEDELASLRLFGTKAIAHSTNRPLTSKFRGVCWNRKNKRWQAAINQAGRYLYLGSYDTQDEAAVIFDKAAVRVRGQKAKLNFRYKDYVDANGEVLPDPLVEQLLKEAQDPHKPRRQRAKLKDGQDGDETGSAGREDGGAPCSTKRRMQSDQDAPPAQDQNIMLNALQHLASLMTCSATDVSLAPAPQGPMALPLPLQQQQQQQQQPLPTVKRSRRRSYGTSGQGTSSEQLPLLAPQAIAGVGQQGIGPLAPLQLPQDNNVVIGSALSPFGSDSILGSLQLLAPQPANFNANANNQPQQPQQQQQQPQQPPPQQQQQQQYQDPEPPGCALQPALPVPLALPAGIPASLFRSPSAMPSAASVGGHRDMFSSISKSLPEGSSLDSIIPCDCEHLMGILYITGNAAGASRLTAVGAGVWNNNTLTFRDLGRYGSDKDAKQACLGTLSILKDLEGAQQRQPQQQAQVQQQPPQQQAQQRHQQLQVRQLQALRSSTPQLTLSSSMPASSMPASWNQLVSQGFADESTGAALVALAASQQAPAAAAAAAAHPQLAGPYRLFAVQPQGLVAASARDCGLTLLPPGQQAAPLAGAMIGAVAPGGGFAAASAPSAATAAAGSAGAGANQGSAGGNQAPPGPFTLLQAGMPGASLQGALQGPAGAFAGLTTYTLSQPMLLANAACWPQQAPTLLPTQPDPAVNDGSFASAVTQEMTDESGCDRRMPAAEAGDSGNSHGHASDRLMKPPPQQQQAQQQQQPVTLGFAAVQQLSNLDVQEALQLFFSTKQGQ